MKGLGNRMNKYTFETFVSGNCNKLAFEVAKEVSQNPGKVYNPLFIYSQPGLGKSHLLKAIQYYIQRQSPEKRVVYVTAVDWMNELIDCLRKNNRHDMQQFEKKYRDLDMLLIDNIQFVANKSYSQEMLICTLKELEIKQKGIVISSDVPPKSTKVDDFLKSMFIGGIIVEIEKPDYQTRLRILHKLQEQFPDMIFEDEALEYIATNIYSNVRVLEGALHNLYSWMKLNADVQTGSLDYEQILANYMG